MDTKDLAKQQADANNYFLRQEFQWKFPTSLAGAEYQLDKAKKKLKAAMAAVARLPGEIIKLQFRVDNFDSEQAKAIAAMEAKANALSALEHAVLVPQPTCIVHKKEIKAWCNNYAGKQGIHWTTKQQVHPIGPQPYAPAHLNVGWVPRIMRVEEHPGVVYFFKDGNVAMHFKLTYG